MNYNPDTVLGLDDMSFFLLLEKKFEKELELLGYFDGGRNILHLIAEYKAMTELDHQKNLQVFEKIIKALSQEQSFDSSFLINMQSKSGVTPLLVSAYYGNFDICKLLVQNGANINIGDCNGYTPLHRACLRFFKEKHDDYVKIVDLLLQVGADINVRDNVGFLPLHDALTFNDDDDDNEYDKHDILDLLLNHPGLKLNIEPRERRTFDVTSPLHLSVQFGLFDVADKLIEKGANIDLEDFDGKKPYDYAEKKDLNFYRKKKLLLLC